jgi:hypothetical protein
MLEPMSETRQLSTADAAPAPAKKHIPGWAVALVLLIFGGIIYGVYANLLQEKPPTVLKNKKADLLPPANGGKNGKTAARNTEN